MGSRLFIVHLTGRDTGGYKGGMARPLRIEEIGCWYHITARGNERREIFWDDKNRQHFLELLEEAVEMFGLRLHVYVLMSNHYHLLLELTETNLSRAIHWLNVSYTVWVNRRRGRSGHLFQGRFKSVVVDAEEWGLELSRYIHLNPVRVQRLGLGKSEQRRSRAVGVGKVDREEVQARIETVRSYRWSSYRAYIGTVKTPGWLTTEAVLKLGGKAKDRTRRYREYCEEPLRLGLMETPWEKIVGQTVLGSERFVEELSARLEEGSRARRSLERRVTWEEIVEVAERMRGEKWEVFRDRHGDTGRDLVLYLGRRVGSLSIRELSKRVEIEYMSAATAVRRFSERLRTDRALSREVDRATAELQNK